MDAKSNTDGTTSDSSNWVKSKLGASALTALVQKYTRLRRYRKPVGLAGPSWITTELAEVLEILLGREGDWVRNNPGDHDNVTDDKLAEELSDVIFMAIFTGIVNGVDPLAAMIKKMEDKWPSS